MHLILFFNFNFILLIISMLKLSLIFDKVYLIRWKFICLFIECDEIYLYFLDNIKTDITHNKGIKWNIFKKLYEFKQLKFEEFFYLLITLDLLTYFSGSIK